MKTPSNQPARPRRALLAGLVTLALAFGGSLSTVGPALADEIASPDAVAVAATPEIGSPAEPSDDAESPASATPAADAAGAPASDAAATAGEGEPEASVVVPAAKPAAEPAAAAASDAPAAVPTITVSKTTGLDPFGETVTVRGTGFTPTAATVGTRPPLQGRFSGVYVAFGAFAESWKPSAGAPSSARPTGDVKWAVHEADVAAVGGAAKGGIAVAEDGTFETTLTVSATYTSLVADGVYGIYTYPGGGAAEPSFETSTPIAFAPKVKVSKTTGLDADGETVTVEGAGFLPSGAATNGTRPPLAGRFGGAYAVFGSFAENWKPSASAPSGNRKVFSQKWAVPAGDVETIGGAAKGAIALGLGGTFTTTLSVAKSDDALANGRYGIYTYPGSGATYAPFETETLLTFAPAVASPQITVEPATDVDSTVENTFTVSGTGFIGAGAVNGAYVLIGESTIWSGEGPLPSAGWLAQGWVMPAQVKDGAFTTKLKIPAGAFDPKKSYVVATSAAHGLSQTDRTLDAFAPVTIKQVSTPTDPGTTPKPPTEPDTRPVVRGGSLSWGVSDAFREYVTGGIANGTITVTGGATRSGGVFQFGQTGGTFSDATGVGTADYAGAVTFRGHGGLLDVTFAAPTLRVESATRGVLSIVAGGSRVDLASVDLGAAARSTTGGATRFADAPVTLLASGEAAFAGFYGAGHALAPLTAVIGSPAAAPAGDTGVVAAAAAIARSTARDIPSTPPATTGVELDAATLAALTEGEQVTIAVGGFEPGETGIQVVVYSTPIVLARDLVADGSGVVTWTGAIPASLEAGVHTLTFQGSVAKGVQFTLAKVERCAVDAATLSWGFKESFRSYLTSGIANGTWEVADGATDAADVFGFAGGTGAYDPETGRGTVTFTGSVRFTGHDGALDTTIANPGLDFDGSGEVFLTLDVHGTTQDGAPVEATRVRFAELDLSSGFESGASGVTGTAIPAVLTAEGAEAFGTYPAGEELDALTFSLPLAADCAVIVPAADTNEVEAVAADSGTEAVAADGASLAWVVWAGIALLVLVLAALAVVLVRRARKSAV